MQSPSDIDGLGYFLVQHWKIIQNTMTENQLEVVLWKSICVCVCQSAYMHICAFQAVKCSPDTIIQRACIPTVLSQGLQYLLCLVIILI